MRALSKIKNIWCMHIFLHFDLIYEVMHCSQLVSSILQISSIKCGMWDSIYDALQSVSVLDLSITPVDKGSKYESISVEPNLTGGPSATERRIEHRLSKYWLILEFCVCWIFRKLLSASVICILFYFPCKIF